MKFFRRRKFILNKNLQYSLLIVSLSYVVLIFMVEGIALFAPSMIEIDRSAYASKKAFQAAHQILYLHDNFWPAGLLCLFLIGVLSIRNSHKIAGPLYRLSLVFNAVKEGNLPRPLICTRRGDYLRAEVELINQMLKGLRTKVKEIQEARAQLDETINKCSEIAGHASKDEIIECMKDVTKKGNQLGYKISYFKIEA